MKQTEERFVELGLEEKQLKAGSRSTMAMPAAWTERAVGCDRRCSWSIWNWCRQGLGLTGHGLSSPVVRLGSAAEIPAGIDGKEHGFAFVDDDGGGAEDWVSKQLRAGLWWNHELGYEHGLKLQLCWMTTSVIELNWTNLLCLLICNWVELLNLQVARIDYDWLMMLIAACELAWWWWPWAVKLWICRAGDGATVVKCSDHGGEMWGMGWAEKNREKKLKGKR